MNVKELYSNVYVIFFSYDRLRKFLRKLYPVDIDIGINRKCF